jgi:hypothetical protein
MIGLGESVPLPDYFVRKVQGKMKKLFAIALLLIFAEGCATVPVSVESRADELAGKAMDAMGGYQAFEQKRFLRFDFDIEFDEGKSFAFQSRHLWDKLTGRCRIEWTFGNSPPMVALINVNTHEGEVFIGGQPAPPDKAKQLLELAHYRFRNETYWLLMPWKMMDPGASREYVGEDVIDGKTYDVVHISFDKSKGMAGDQFWAYINQRTGMMDRFAYFLEDFEGEATLEDASVWVWNDWETIGGLKLARERTMVTAPKEPYQTGQVRYPLLTFLDKVDEKVFDSPAMPLP